MIIIYKKMNVFPLWVPFIRESVLTEGSSAKTIPAIRIETVVNILLIWYNRRNI